MNKRIAEMDVNELASVHITDCSCGKVHQAKLKEILLRPGALSDLPGLVGRLGAKKAFIYFDRNTKTVAGSRTLSELENAGIPFTQYCYPQAALEPNNEAVDNSPWLLTRVVTSSSVLAQGRSTILAKWSRL